MAAKSKAPLIRWAYYYGSKKIQVGPNKGGVKAGFIALQPKVASALGLKLNLPKDIPGTTYTVEDGVVYDSHNSGKGKKVKTPIKARVGSKKVTLTVEKSAARGLGMAESKTKVKGKAAVKSNATTESIVVGLPAWADIEQTRKFLQGSKVISFSFGGGNPYLVKAGKS
jgi:hypothetical protein